MAKIVESGFSIDDIPATLRIRKGKYEPFIDALLEHKTLKLKVDNPDDLPLNKPGHEAFRIYVSLRNSLSQVGQRCRGRLEGDILWLWREEKKPKK